MAEQIYHLNEHGQLVPMNEEPFELEDNLQELVAKHPGLLSGEQINPDNPRRFILVGREQGIADIIGGSNRWSLDHLLIDQDAIPTLVEAKRQANSEIRREIVGQMMDYAAHATQTWNAGDIREVFESRADDPDAELALLLQEEPDIEKFWHDVETNLRAARLRLLFVSDGIPDELTRVVEFLNKQMPDIEVLAVEIKHFKGETGSTLVPRVIGRTAAVSGSSSILLGRDNNRTEQAFLVRFPEGSLRDAAARICSLVHNYRGAGFNPGRNRMTIRARCPAWPQRLSIAWLNVPDTSGRVGAGFSFGYGNGESNFFDRLTPNVKNVLEKWHGEFASDDFAKATSQTGIKAVSISHQDAAANIDLLCERLDRVLRELAELQPEGD